VPLGKALKSTDSSKWKEAINSEYNSLLHNNTFDIVDRKDIPDSSKIIPIRIILTLKDEPDGLRFK
jgi:hypothetical protein